jgi:hypothetical protein
MSIMKKCYIAGINAAANLFLAFLGVLPKYREVSSAAAWRLGWRLVDPHEASAETDPPIIPVVPLSHIVKNPEPVLILEPDLADGNVTVHELLAISQIVRMVKPDKSFEIGTYDGRTTLNIAANSPDIGCVYTLDLPASRLNDVKLRIAESEKKYVNKDESGVRYKKSKWSNKILQLYGDSASFDYSEYIEKIDLVFIDGSHTCEYLRNDTEVALKLLRKSGGVILWHDYSSPSWRSLTGAINDLFLSGGTYKNMINIQGTTLVLLDLRQSNDCHHGDH